jgi:phage terminase small subunit
MIADAGGEYQRVPTVAKDDQGNTAYMVRRHPACLTMEKLLPELRQLEDRFGMSPMSRASLLNKGLSGGLQGDLLPGEASAGDVTPDPSAFN